MTPVDIGVGARAVLARPATGRVLAVYAKAAYLELPDGLVALTNTDAPRGPLHVRVAALPHLRPGDLVVIDRTELRVGDCVLSLNGPTWEGELPPAARLKAHRAVAAAATRGIPLPELLGGAVLSERRLAGALRAGDVESLARLLGGRGPGLTPSGDDVLAGIFLVARALWGERAEPRLCAAAAAVATNRIAAAFLGWAAKGRLIEPAHEFLRAVAAGDPVSGRTCVRTLLTFGHSSGRDLVGGLRLGLRCLPATGA